MTAKTGNPRGRPPKLETLVARAVNQALTKPVQQITPTGTSRRGKVKARYDAAGQGRRMAAWNPTRTSPNTAIAGVERIRERSRDSSRNDWAGASFVQKWTTSLVGIGITPRWKKIKAKAKKEKVVKLFAKWARKADADGVLDIFGLQTMVVRTWFDGGECFARRRNRFVDSGLPVPMQIQLLEADMCPMLDATTYEGLPVGNEIKSGIEFDKRGKRIAYWFYKQHPGDNIVTNFDGKELVRVAASEVCHIFEPKRPGQIRGVSEAAPILARLRTTADYEDATLERQKLANLFVAFVKRTMPDFDPNASDVDPVSGEPIEDDDFVPNPIAGLQPGAVQVLDDGESMEFSNPPEAGTTFSDYLRTTQLGTSAGGGLPYEFMSGDILNISDRTLRITMNEFRRFAEQRQWQIIIPMFCQPVIDWFAEAAVLMGEIALEDVENVTDVEHSPHGWPDIHPTQDIEGRIAAVGAGFRSQSSVISARGDDPDQVAQEIAEDEQRMKDLKIGAYSEAAQQANKPAPAPAPAAPLPSPAPKPAPAPAPAQDAKATAEELAIMARITALLEPA